MEFGHKQLANGENCVGREGTRKERNGRGKGRKGIEGDDGYPPLYNCILLLRELCVHEIL